MNRRDREQALARIVEETRIEASPEIDANRVFDTVMRRRAEEGDGDRPSLRATRPKATLMLVAAAAVVLGVIGAAMNTPRAIDDTPRHTDNASAPPVTERSDSAIDGERLSPRTRLVAADHVIVVDHAGRARWTLEAGSAARLRKDDADRRTVLLERGSVRASVVPSSLDESFAVEVSGARIAVHGTRFRVALVGDRLEVSVDAGVVSVAPLVGGSKQMLRAPAEGRFLLNGAPEPTTRQRPPHRPPASPETSTDEAPDGAVATPEHAEPELADGTQEGAAVSEADARRVADAVAACFLRNTSPEGDLRVSAATTLTARVRPDGRIEEAVFQPPLAPGVRACAEASLKNLALSSSPEGATLERHLVLQR